MMEKAVMISVHPEWHMKKIDTMAEFHNAVAV